MNPKHSIEYRAVALRLTVFATLALMTSAVNAYYTVIEEEAAPTRPSIVTRPPLAKPTIDQYAIPFFKGTTPVNSNNRGVLDAIFPKIKDGEQIKIVGRGDAMYSMNADATMLARKRAINIRDYLTRKGIPLNSIVIETDNTPNPQIDGSTYPSYIYITRFGKQDDPLAEASPQESVTPVRHQLIEMNSRVAISTNDQIPSIQSGRPNNGRDKLMAYINAGVQSGIMSSAVALQLLQALMESEAGESVTMAVKPIKRNATNTEIIEPQFTKQVWVLEKAMTLRENMDAWSKSAGWNPITWDASNYYQITATSIVKGDYPEVLRKIAESTNLNICVKTRERTIRVTDQAVSCN